MYGIYRNGHLTHLDAGPWFSFGMFRGYLNYFKNYPRRGVEVFFSPMRRLSWLRCLGWTAAVWKGPAVRRPRAKIDANEHWPKLAAFHMEWLWFGLRLWCPAWLGQRAFRRRMRQLDREMDEFARLHPECFPEPEEEPE
jgi:hypothetical protein